MRPARHGANTQTRWRMRWATGVRALRFPSPVRWRWEERWKIPHGLLKLSGRPLLTRHAVHLLGQDQEFPATRAREDFGFAPRVRRGWREAELARSAGVVEGRRD